MLQHPQKENRIAAITALASLKDSSFASVLKPLLNDSESTVRDMAVIALAQLGDASVLPMLIKIIQDNSSSSVGFPVTFDLRQVGLPAVPLLLEAISDHVSPSEGDKRVRAIAAIILGQIGSPSALPTLEKLLQDPDRFVKIVAAVALLAITGVKGLAVGNPPQPPGVAELNVCSIGCQYNHIQDAIDASTPGTTIRIGPGVYQENLEISKSLTLLGTGREQTMIKEGQPFRNPVVLIDSRFHAEIAIRSLAIVSTIDHGAISTHGNPKMTVLDSRISGNWWGLEINDSTQLTLKSTEITHNWIDGLIVQDIAEVTVYDSNISGNDRHGLFVLGNSPHVSLTNATISGNKFSGLLIRSAAAVLEVRNSTIEGNGIDTKCPTSGLCDGITMADGHSQAIIINSRINSNSGWGIASWSKKCGYKEDEFKGKVIFQGDNITVNNKQGSVCGPDGSATSSQQFPSLSDSPIYFVDVEPGAYQSLREFLTEHNSNSSLKAYIVVAKEILDNNSVRLWCMKANGGASLASEVPPLRFK